MIIVEPLGGLGNRLRVIESAVELSRMRSETIIVIWNLNSGLNSKYSELFLPLNNCIFWEGKISKYNLRNVLIHLLELIIFLVPGSRIIRDNEVRNSRSSSGIYKVSREKNRLLYVSTCFDFFKGNNHGIFKPIAGIEDKCFKEEELRGCIGIHIRRTDNLWSIEESPIELFVELIEHWLDEDQTKRFYLATDCNETRRFLLGLFPLNLITSSFLELNRGTASGMSTALIDMVNLSRCDQIYGTYKSSFSDLAALIGDKDKIELRV